MKVIRFAVISLTTIISFTCKAAGDDIMHLLLKDGNTIDYNVVDVVEIYFSNNLDSIIIKHEAVDLGLSVKWATCNIGAEKPGDYGDYFAWGETETKDTYTRDNSKWERESLSSFQSHGVIYSEDSNYNLTPQFDAATVIWGDAWRMPTADECFDLVYHCRWEWDIQDGHNGYKVTGPNGNSIFLPAAGFCDESGLDYLDYYGLYWGATYFSDFNAPWRIHFYPDFYDYAPDSIYNGLTIRPVLSSISTLAKEDVLHIILNDGNTNEYNVVDVVEIYFSNSSDSTIINHEAVDLGLSVKWASCNIGAEKPGDYGDYFAWGETETKDTYTYENSIWGEESYSSLQSLGVIDSKDNLTPQYDAATVNWGDDWRMPTIDDLYELVYYCRWKWDIQDGHYGYKVTGPNGNSIFLPAAGYRHANGLDGVVNHGRYWCAQVFSTYCNAYYLAFNSSYCDWGFTVRYYGMPVRPVTK